MSVISSIANFYNYSPKRQTSLTHHIKNYPDNSLKTKLLPLCKTRWVERINAFEVALDLIEAVTDAFSEMSQNVDRQWNRDTVAQASSLLKSVDFEFIINLVITQKILAYTSGITTTLQTRGIDLANASDQVNFVIRTLSHVRQDVERFHHTFYDEACRIARKISVDIKRPRVCARQVHRQNALLLNSGLSDDQLIEEYFRINVTIPFLDDVLGCLQIRFDGQKTVMKGTMLIPLLQFLNQAGTLLLMNTTLC